MRVALYGWGEFEVVWNPCEESLGVCGALAPCQQWLNTPNRFSSKEFAQQRLALVKQLGKLGTDAVPHFIQALKDDDASVREASAEALGKTQDPQATPHLIQALKDEKWRVRYVSAWALGRVGEASALPALQRALQKPKTAEEREAIQDAIRAIQKSTKQAR